MRVVILAALVAYQGGSMAPTGKGVYEVEYDLGRSFEDRVKEADFAYVDPNITGANFGREGCGTEWAALEMVRFESDIVTTDEALAGIKRRGLRPAEPDELVALVRAYPKFAKAFPIAALGKAWRGRVVLAGPYRGDSKLDLEYERGEWTIGVRFLAAKERR